MRKLIIKGKTIDCVKIVTGESEAEKYAAREFIKYMEKLTGIAVDGEFPIYIRINDSIGFDGYRFTVEEDSLYLEGGTKRGVIYAVYKFLEKYAGMRFLTTEIELEGEGDIIVDEGEEFVPPFWLRQGTHKSVRTGDWSLKHGLNNFGSLSEEQGGNVGYVWSCHTFALLTDTDQNTEQPCLSDPKNLEKAITRLKNELAKHRDKDNVWRGGTYFSVSQNDNKNYCKCEKCAAIDEEEGSHMGSILRFVNAVAEAIEEEYPEVVIDTLSYQYSTKPPKITKPRKNVCIRYCTLAGCFSHWIGDDSCKDNKTICEELKGWSEICDNIQVWEYIANYSHYLPPYPNLFNMRRNFRFFVDNNAKGVFPNGREEVFHSAEFDELRAYLIAKLMWDPRMSEVEYNAHMNDFLRGYYGEGWRYIRCYIDWTNAEVAVKHIHHCYDPFDIISREMYEAAEEAIDLWWNKAEELAGDKIDNVQRSRLQWDYMKLMLHPDPVKGEKLYNDVVKWKVNWKSAEPLPNDPYDYADPPIDWWDMSVYPWEKNNPRIQEIKERRAARDKLKNK